MKQTYEIPNCAGLAYLTKSGQLHACVSASKANELSQRGIRIFLKGREISGFDTETGLPIPMTGAETIEFWPECMSDTYRSLLAPPIDWDARTAQSVAKTEPVVRDRLLLRLQAEMEFVGQ